MNQTTPPPEGASAPTVPAKPKLTGRGGPGRGQGRKKGSLGPEARAILAKAKKAAKKMALTLEQAQALSAEAALRNIMAASMFCGDHVRAADAAKALLPFEVPKATALANDVPADVAEWTTQERIGPRPRFSTDSELPGELNEAGEIVPYPAEFGPVDPRTGLPRCVLWSGYEDLEGSAPAWQLRQHLRVCVAKLAELAEPVQTLAELEQERFKLAKAEATRQTKPADNAKPSPT